MIDSRDIKEQYFEWMYKLVEADTRRPAYTKLLRHLNEVDFDYSIDMDGNRFEDGIDLRYRFGYDNGIGSDEIEFGLDDHNCSILEMMVALALNCEEHIMCDPEIGDRTAEWFWTMIESLGLMEMNDRNYHESLVDSTISRFLNHEYEPNGRGGLFTLEHPRDDMRNTEIWYQLNWYLDEYIEKEEQHER